MQVGLNPRFAPASSELRQLLRSSPGPKTVSYRVMAGQLDPAHWYANYAESGGRVVGEACHFLDYFLLFDSEPVRVSAQTIWPVTGRLPFPDGVSAQVEFADESCGQLLYSSEGDHRRRRSNHGLRGWCRSGAGELPQAHHSPQSAPPRQALQRQGAC